MLQNSDEKIYGIQKKKLIFCNKIKNIRSKVSNRGAKLLSFTHEIRINERTKQENIKNKDIKIQFIKLIKILISRK